MKKRALLIAAFGIPVLALSLESSAQVAAPAATCSLATLKGSYNYSAHGFIEGKPYASAGTMSFDGAGRVALIYARSVERTQLSTNGTYTVDPNCSGSMNLATGTVNSFYLGPTGDKFMFVRSTGNSAVTGEARRVTEGLIVKAPTP